MLCCRKSGSDSDDDKSFQEKHNSRISTDQTAKDQTAKDGTGQEEINLPKQDETTGPDSLIVNNSEAHKGHSEVEQIPKGPEKETKEQNNSFVDKSETEDNMSSEALATCVGRLEAVASRLEELAKTGSVGSSRSSSGEPEVVSAAVGAYNEAVDGALAKFLELSAKIGGDVKTMADKVQDAFLACKAVVVMASKSKKPSDADLPKLLKPLQDCISAVQSFRESNRPSPHFNHLSAVSESIAALGWVAVAPTPGPYVKEMLDAGVFYTNRVLKEFKEKDQTHVDWSKSWGAIFASLQVYIKEHHTTGLTWNPQGGVATLSSAAAPSGGAPCPPPGPPAPPPPPPPPSVAEASSDGGNDARAALMDSLNKGTDITQGLKKVTDNMKTHKNPALRQKSVESAGNDGLKKVSDDMKTHKNPTLRQGPAPFKAAPPKPAPKPAPKPVAAQPKQKPPVFELMDKKWIIENQVGNNNLVIDNTNMKQSVYAFKCENCTIVVKGKINAITLDSCKKVGIAFDDLLCSLEFINCQSVKGQVLGKVPTISIDKTDGCMIYLSKDSLDTSVVTAKSSEMNILVPKGEGDYAEFAVPEQFKTMWDGSKFKTTISDIA